LLVKKKTYKEEEEEEPYYTTIHLFSPFVKWSPIDGTVGETVTKKPSAIG